MLWLPLLCISLSDFMQNVRPDQSARTCTQQRKYIGSTAQIRVKFMCIFVPYAYFHFYLHIMIFGASKYSIPLHYTKSPFPYTLINNAHQTPKFQTFLAECKFGHLYVLGYQGVFLLLLFVRFSLENFPLPLRMLWGLQNKNNNNTIFKQTLYSNRKQPCIPSSTRSFPSFLSPREKNIRK